MKTGISVLALFLMIATETFSQGTKPNLQDKTQLSSISRTYKAVDDQGKKGIYVEKGDGSNLITLNNIVFTNGEIELDLKGRNLMGESFVGFAFHVQNDSTYDAIYFRPFNFSNPDTVRRWRAVQYISHPAYTWDKLRAEFPGKYENKVNPVPNGDEWFHCRIVVKDKQVSVYVNRSSQPSLVVDKLTNTTTGKMGFWIENGSDASFANLEIRPK
jgi:hypothetical protein